MQYCLTDIVTGENIVCGKSKSLAFSECKQYTIECKCRILSVHYAPYLHKEVIIKCQLCHELEWKKQIAFEEILMKYGNVILPERVNIDGDILFLPDGKKLQIKYAKLYLDHPGLGGEPLNSMLDQIESLTIVE